ncbi:VENN motif pre-toxin domain-containing protein [Snodgrassella alvi]|uniref:VENN motif pre-toxin domain-containing protein n=1 Tax=Snodgrassella alvi TaxID=1196083 RepID=UPI003516D772
MGSVWEASGNFSSSNASGHLNGVNQQSGLFAGKDGYHIKADSVDLQGGAIGSTADKEHNQLTTNSLTFKDIENHSDFHASNASIGGGFSGDGPGPVGNPSYTPGLPQYESGSDHTTTHATLSPGQIIINGKETSVEELGIHSDISTAHSKVNDLPDLQQIMDKQQAVADATATIMQSVRTLSTDMANKADKEKQQAKKAAEEQLQTEGGEILNKYNSLNEAEKAEFLKQYSSSYKQAEEQAQAWGIGGNKSRALNAVTTAITGALGGQTNIQVVANTLAPYASELIGKQFGHGENKNEAAQLVAHAILGAVTASVNGGSAAAGAAGASSAELAAQYLINHLPKDQYPEAIDPTTGEIDPNRLPENVKGSIRDLSSAIGTVAGGLSGGTLSNAQIAGELGQNAVENNALINSKGESKLNAQERKINEKLKKAGVQSADDYQRKYDACQTKECRQQVIENYKKASEEASQIILSLYMKGQLTEEESKILLTSYASKMMQGAGESQDGWGTPIFNMDAQKWTPSGKIANAAFQKITLTNLVRDMKQSGATEQQIGMRVLQFQIAGQALSSYSLSDQVDALYGTGMSLGTMLNVMSIKRGKAFSMDEIKAITNRYNSHSGSLVTANGVVIKDKPQSSTVSESRGGKQRI